MKISLSLATARPTISYLITASPDVTELCKTAKKLFQGYEDSLKTKKRAPEFVTTTTLENLRRPVLQDLHPFHLMKIEICDLKIRFHYMMHCLNECYNSIRRF